MASPCLLVSSTAELPRERDRPSLDGQTDPAGGTRYKRGLAGEPGAGAGRHARTSATIAQHTPVRQPAD